MQAATGGLAPRTAHGHGRRVTTTRYEDLPEAVRRHYPWPGKHLALDDGTRLHYLDEGAGDPVLMVHGNPTWSFYYRDLVRALSGEYRCVVPDHVGCGLSDKPLSYSYRLANHIENLAQLIERLDLRDITLVVHDWGGAIGFGAAMKRLERVKRLVIFNTAVFDGPMPFSIRSARWPGTGALMVRGANGFLRGTLFLFLPKGVPAGVLAGYLAPYDSWDHRVAIHRFVQDIPIEQDHPTRAVIDEVDRGTSKLRHLPALIVWGERDFVFTRQFLDGWRARLPDAEVHALPRAGHLVVEDAHEEIVTLIRDFLGRHPLSKSA